MVDASRWQSTQWKQRNNARSSIFSRVSTCKRIFRRHEFQLLFARSIGRLDVALFASMDVDSFCNFALCSTVEILKGRECPLSIRCHGDKFQRDPRNIQLLLKKSLTPLSLISKVYIAIWLRGRVAMAIRGLVGKRMTLHENENWIESCAIECCGRLERLFYSSWWDWFGKMWLIEWINFEHVNFFGTCELIWRISSSLLYLFVILFIAFSRWINYE